MSEVQDDKISSYLTFNLGSELFASHVNFVLKILEMQHITEVPKSPPYMKGVINLRGNVVPVIDARIKFGIKAAEYTPRTVILVLSLIIDGDKVEVGAIVDAVKDVVEYNSHNIMPTPGLGSKYKADFIEGVMKIDDKFVMVLNMNSVFSNDEIIDLQEKSEQLKKNTPKQKANSKTKIKVGGEKL